MFGDPKRDFFLLQKPGLILKYMVSGKNNPSGEKKGPFITPYKRYTLITSSVGEAGAASQPTCK